MRKIFAIAIAFLAMSAIFTSCKKEENRKEDKNYAARISGTYLGTNEFKIETTAEVIITRSSDEYVAVQYDANIEEDDTKELAPVGFEVRVKKEGDKYTLSGNSAIESIVGDVTGTTLKMQVFQGEVEIINFVGTKQ